MSTAASRVCAYSLDRNDTLVSLGPGFEAFARENGAPDLPRRALGRAVWEYVVGVSTRHLYEVIFDRVRRQRCSLVLPFRCDSPQVFRSMELRVRPGEDDGIELQGELLWVQDRPYFSLLDRLALHSEVLLCMCSVCKRTQIPGGAWLEPEQAVRQHGLFQAIEPPDLEYGVCDDCLARARDPAPQPRGGCA